MIVITDFPTKNVNGLSTLPSRWSSVHQPILFKGCRRDRNVLQVQAASAGQYRVTVIGGIPGGVAVGQKVWVKSGATSLEATITNIVGSQIYVVGAFTTNTTGGYINFTTLRKNYFVTLRIYVTDENNIYQRIGSHDVRPSADGSFSFDPHGFLKSYAELTDGFAYNVKNKKMVKQGSRYNFSWIENWTGTTTAESTLSSTTLFYWVNAVKQLQEKYNFNVGAHVLFPSINTAKFMSDFETPTYFPGFPFSLSFIWSDKVAGRELQRVEDTGTLNTTVLDPSQCNFVNRLMLAGSYPTSVESLEVWLNDNGITTIKYVEDGYVSPTYVKEIPAEPLAITG